MLNMLVNICESLNEEIYSLEEVDSSIRDREDLTLSHKALYTLLLRLSYKKGYCYAGDGFLSSCLECSPIMVTLMISYLCLHNFIYIILGEDQEVGDRRIYVKQIKVAKKRKTPLFFAIGEYANVYATKSQLERVISEVGEDETMFLADTLSLYKKAYSLPRLRDGEILAEMCANHHLFSRADEECHSEVADRIEAFLEEAIPKFIRKSKLPLQMHPEQLNQTEKT
jgi:hypothetical protein